MMEISRKRRIVKLIVFVLPMFLIVFAGLVWAVSALWNELMPAIFGLRTITYWQALGLMALSWILFRGFRGPSMGHRYWRRDLREHWGKMTPAEREEFMKALRSRWARTESAGPEPRA